MAFKDPLKFDAKTVKEFDIPKRLDASASEKLTYIDSQLESMRLMLWRARVDLILTQNLTTSPVQELASRGRQSEDEYRNTLKQGSQALRTMFDLHDQLVEATPEEDRKNHDEGCEYL